MISCTLTTAIIICDKLFVCQSTGEDEYGEGDHGKVPFQWSMYLPIRLAPVVLALKKSACSSSSCSSSFSPTGISLSALQGAVEGDRIFPDEVRGRNTVTSAQ
jgi:hypothetical protein